MIKNATLSVTLWCFSNFSEREILLYFECSGHGCGFSEAGSVALSK